MLTAAEVLFVKDLVQTLADLTDPAEYTTKEVDLALELLNRLEPIDDEKFLDFMDSIDEEDE